MYARGTAAVDTVHVVIRIKRMSLPGIAAEIAFAFNAETLKEHDRDIYPLVPRCLDASAHPVEIGLVEELYVELGLAIGCFSRPRSLVRHGVIPSRALFWVGVIRTFPGPEAKEVVIVLLEEGEVRGEVEGGRRSRL